MKRSGFAGFKIDQHRRLLSVSSLRQDSQFPLELIELLRPLFQFDDGCLIPLEILQQRFIQKREQRRGIGGGGRFRHEIFADLLA